MGNVSMSVKLREKIEMDHSSGFIAPCIRHSRHCYRAGDRKRGGGG